MNNKISVNDILYIYIFKTEGNEYQMDSNNIKSKFYFPIKYLNKDLMDYILDFDFNDNTTYKIEPIYCLTNNINDNYEDLYIYSVCNKGGYTSVNIQYKENFCNIPFNCLSSEIMDFILNFKNDLSEEDRFFIDLYSCR